MENTKGRKRTLAIIAVVVCLALAAVGGTIAWLTASNSVANNFTVGEITDPDTPPSGEPDPDVPGSDATLEGNIYEIFKQDSKIIPGEDVVKRAWIGIGDKSENSFVFAYVDNKMMAEGGVAGAEDYTYFTLNKGWKPVTGEAHLYNNESGKYTGGLFMWVGEDGTSDYPVALIGNENADVWTNQPVFNTVEIPGTAVASDFAQDPVMNVHSFIIAQTEQVDGAKAMSEAEAWVDGGLQPIAGTAAE